LGDCKHLQKFNSLGYPLVGKVNQPVENIFRIWHETKSERTTQLVISDISTPKDKGFSVDRDAVKKLERLGVLTSEIAFIQDYNSDASKLSLFRDVRSGTGFVTVI
jgi:hypothetical protein